MHRVRAVEKIELVEPFLFRNEGFFQLPLEMWLDPAHYLRSDIANEFVIVVGVLTTTDNLYISTEESTLVSTEESTLVVYGQDFYVIPYVNLAGDECKKWSRI